MSEPLGRAMSASPASLSDSDVNGLLLVAGGAVDDAARMMLSNRAWDVSAGVLLAREAGGLVYDWDGSEHGLGSNFTIASAPSLKRSLLELLPGPR
jgi:myo-inositol-1(or 4)-monophosphatase